MLLQWTNLKISWMHISSYDATGCVTQKESIGSQEALVDKDEVLGCLCDTFDHEQNDHGKRKCLN